MYYSGSLRQNIIQMDFADDTDDFSEDVLFEKHYAILKKLRGDSLIILDNFNVLPKDEPLFKEFAQNRFKLLITTRCHLKNYPVLTLKELDKDTELTQLFFKHCPSAKGDADTVSKIIDTLHCHTLTVILAALSLSASGMEADEMLYELQTCGLNLSSGEDVELYKDGDYTDGLMTEHLRKLLQLGKLSNSRLNILRNLSLLPLSGVLKASFKSWLKLTDLNDVNYLAKYGFINDDSENRSISLHPLIQEVVFLLFLQDMFPYLEKYLVTEYLPKVVARIEYVMGEIKYSDENTTLCDMALQVLSTYEALVLEYEGSHSFDYGVCELMHGVIALSTGNATEAENRLLSAESIIGDVMGCDNDYMKSVYQYLYYLYTRWNKSELAFKYEKKYRDSHTLLR